jgi:peptidoglycan glycosyltransferase
LKKPSLISRVIDNQTKETVWTPQYKLERVLSDQSVSELEEMMNFTVDRGTARSSFRGMRRSLRKKLTIGGKTGSITGGVPYGKRDWFVSYAKPKEGNDAGISVSVMIVNKEKWYIKSAYLAKQVIQYYYDQKENWK